MSEPNKVEKTSRQVIEHKLLTALEDENAVAAVFTKQDLDDLIYACDSESRHPDDISQKYYDGKPGGYICTCAHCFTKFYGDKRDATCPKCSGIHERIINLRDGLKQLRKEAFP